MNWLFPDFIFDTYILSIITTAIMILNILLAISLIFLERRNAQSLWAWLLILFFLPIIGFILYMLFGRTIYKKSIFAIPEDEKLGMAHLVENQLNDLDDDSFEFPNETTKKYHQMIHMLLYNDQSFLTHNNSIQTFTNGHDKFDSLLEDIRNAKDHIHFQYYILKMDGIGQALYDALLEKQKEGVTVKILYDDMGSRGLNLKSFGTLKKEGGDAKSFFSSIFPLINPRVNNRNHRKIVVIDGKIGYVGGFNVGDEYLGRDKKFGFWRDTHLKIQGNAVRSLQLRFVLDWNSQPGGDRIEKEERYFPEIPSHGEKPIQIVTSGPDEEWEQIKYGYLQMIHAAKHEIYIQTPYFIPDQAFFEALKVAILSGVKVHLMIPSFPDHPFVYWATYSNAGTLVKMGAIVHTYEKGFNHQKVLMVDDEVLSIGTTNVDVRSFALNFEVNAFIYDKEQAEHYRKIYEADMQDAALLTEEKYKARSNWIKVKEGFAQLVSPIL